LRSQQCVVVSERAGTVRHCDRPLDVEKTELMWAGTRTRYTIASFLRLHHPTLTLGTDTVKAADAVRVLGILYTQALNDSQCQVFFQLRQLRRVRRSLDRKNAATLVHAFVTSRIDYGNALFANAPRTTTDKLQCSVS